MKSHIQHQSFWVKQLSNKELLSHTKLLVQKERSIHIQVLSHLSEIDSRKLFFKQGFSSLFDYAVRELGYSEGAAYRRIKAMKLCREIPETANRLKSGRLSLSSASQLQVFFEKQDKRIKEEAKKALPLKPHEERISKNEIQEQESEKTQELKQKPIPAWLPQDILSEKIQEQQKSAGEVLKSEQNSQSNFQVFKKKVFQNEDFRENSKSHPLSREEKENLVKKAEGCSTRATEKLISEIDPSLSLLKREKVRFLEKDKVEVKIVIDEQCHKNLEKLKNLLSHKNPYLSYGELISILSKEALKKHDPGEKTIRPRKEEKIQKNTSIKKPEFKDKSAELAASCAMRLRQKDEIPKHLEALSEKSVTSARKQVFPEGKLLTSTSKSAGLATFSEKLEQIDQYSKRKASFTLRPGHQIKKLSRYIPTYLRKYIWERDQGQCTYIHHETKRRCASRHLLQIDHIQPFALGGRTEKENLRLLCAGHNQYRR